MERNNILYLAAGILLGYFVAKQQLEADFEERVNAEIADTRAFYKEFYKKVTDDVEETEFLEEANNVLEGVLAEVKASKADQTAKADATEAATALVNYQTGNMTEPAPADDKPVLEIHRITFGEFDEEEPEYSQISLTYYEGDDELTDEMEQPIPRSRVELMVGRENLKKFGEDDLNDSDFDENTIYIRNENLDTKFEVTRSRGKYSVEVLGESG